MVGDYGFWLLAGPVGILVLFGVLGWGIWCRVLRALAPHAEDRDE